MQACTFVRVYASVHICVCAGVHVCASIHLFAHMGGDQWTALSVIPEILPNFY